VQDVQKAVGQRLRELRKKRGWSQDEFADLSGLHRAHVGAAERGERNLTLRTLKTAADTLKVPLQEIFRGL